MFGQEKRFSSKLAIIEDRIESIAEITQEDELDYTTLLDDLGFYFDHPINLNRAKEGDLKALHLLSDIQIRNLFEHIEKNGKLLAIYELQSIKGYNLDLIRQILPFVKVNRPFDAPKLTFKDLIENGSYELISRYQRNLEEVEGFSPISDSAYAANPNSRYLGSPVRSFNRVRYKYGNKISLGITAENDAGEEFFTGSNANGFDFYSAHAYIRDVGRIKQLAVGDYHAQFGQGLTFWSGLGFGKSADVMSVKKNASKIRPYSSVDENIFMRGLAVTMEALDFEITGFVSQKDIDANISSLDTIDQDQVKVSSFQYTGLHRTPNEVMDKNAIGEYIYGGNIQYKSRDVNIGFTAASTNLSGEVERNLQIYNQFEFNSNENTNIGVDYNIVKRNFNFFGEFSRSANGGTASLNGALIALGEKASMSIVHRNYGKDYQSLYAEGFAEGSKVSNESGLYMGLEFKPFRKWTISTYMDQFKFPWLRYQVDAPSGGYEYLVQVAYKPSKTLRAYMRYRNETRGINEFGSDDYIPGIEWKTRENLRFDITYGVTKALKLRSRIEVARFHQPSKGYKGGYMTYQDIIYKPMDSRLSITSRFCMFDTDDYDSRIYMYESDVLYYFYIPAVYHRGLRNYLLLKYRVNRNIDLWTKLGQTYYTNRDEIGSGLNTNEGPTRTDFKVQLRIRF